jgi:hypothetical protein
MATWNVNEVRTAINRYMFAKARYRHFSFNRRTIILPRVIRELVDGIRHFNLKDFEGDIDPTSPKVITADYNDPDFFAAIMEERDGVIDMSAADLQKYRQYVLHGEGSLPVATEC